MAEPSRKRILILVENLPVPFDRRVWMEATTLRSAGYQVSVICPQGNYEARHEVLDGISIYRYPLPSLSGIAGHVLEYGVALPMTMVLTFVVLWREGFDVIQSANPPDLFFLIGGFFKLFGKRFVFDHHDPMPEICESRWQGWKLSVSRRLCAWAERASFRTADRIIANNETFRALALGRGGVAADKVVVVRSAPSRQGFQPQPPRPELKSGARFLVAYLGVMGPNDGMAHLLRAIGHIINSLQRRDIRFVLIGSGDLYAQTVAMSHDLRVGHCVHFTGRIPDDEVRAWLSSADLCVAPDPKDALNDISSMNKIVEYMAMGKPIVAFDLREVRVSAGSAAQYVGGNDAEAFAETVVRLLEAPEERRSMGEAGRRRFETTLAWEHQQAALLGLYRDLLGAPA